MDAMMINAYQFHRGWPVGAHEVGMAAKIAWAAAKAERVARDRAYVFNWIWDAEEEWTVLVFTQEGECLAAIGGIDSADEASNQYTRAWEAAVAVDALWAELFQRGEAA